MPYSTYTEGGDVNRINKFAREWLIQHQREMSDFMPYVSIDTDFNAEYKFFPKIDTVAAFKERQQRMETIDINVTDQTRRRMSKKTYYTTEGYDTIDELYGSLSVDSPLSKQMLFKANILKDQIIIDAALGTAYEGKDGSTSVAFNAAQIIDANGTTGATFAKLKELRYKAKKNHLKEGLVWFVDPYQMGELLAISELVDFDLNSKRDLEKGRIISWANIDIVETNALTLTGGTIRETVAMVRGAVKFGVTQDVNMRTKSLEPQNFGEVIIAELTAGAVRLQDEAVFKVRCLES